MFFKMFRTIWISAIAIFAFHFAECHQRVAPGVPPQQYQQPHGHGMHQMPLHTQQQYQPPSPSQHNQPPPQPQQTQIHHQQQLPVHQQQHQVTVQQQQPHGHGHGHHHGQQQVLNANVAQERNHIAEHMEIPMDTSKMTDQELQFHYFKMHDADGNSKLDGCELIKSLIHWHEQGNTDPSQPASGEKLFKDEELVSLIDPILDMDDTNKDGYIDYTEFIQAQQKATATSGRPDHA